MTIRLTNAASMLPLLLLPVTVASHEIILEHEIDQCLLEGTCYGALLPPNNPGDSSFAIENTQQQPFKKGEEGTSCEHNIYGVSNSQVVFGYLNDADDFDVYEYHVTPADYHQAKDLGPPYNIPGQPYVFVSASVFPQACQNKQDEYFSLAVVADPFELCGFAGPLPASDYSLLPSKLVANLPPNKTVVMVSDEPPDASQVRSIYTPPRDDLAHLQWFLPKGCEVVLKEDGSESLKCSQDAKTIGLYACNQEWKTADPPEDMTGENDRVVSNQDVQIQFVVFAASEPQDELIGGMDYSLNIGISEECFSHDHATIDRLGGNAHLVTGCEELEEVGEEEEMTAESASPQIHFGGWWLLSLAPIHALL